MIASRLLTRQKLLGVPPDIYVRIVSNLVNVE
jgi:hypothetical protein